MIKKIFRYFSYDMKLSNKLLISFLLLLSIPAIAATTLLYGQINDVIVNGTLKSQEELVGQTVDTVNAQLTQIREITNIIRGDSFLSDILTVTGSEATGAASLNTPQSEAFVRSVGSYIDGKRIKNIKLYMSPDFEELYEGRDETYVFMPFDRIRNSYWYGIMSATDTTSLQCPAFYLSHFELDNYGDLSFVRRMRFAGTRQDETAGFIVIYTDSDEISSALSHETDLEGSVDYIINSRDNLVASSDISLAGTYFLSNSDLDELLDEPGTFVLRNVLGTDIYTCYHTLEDTDWRLVSMIPALPLKQRSNALLLQYATVFSTALLLAVAAALLLSRGMTRRITRLIREMDANKGDRVRLIDAPGGQDEIGELILTYNDMAVRINDLISREALAAEKIKTSEFNALQAQINPHFLYNTLDMINWMAVEGRGKDASQAIRALSNFYKLTLSGRKNIDTVENELKQVSLYVELMNMRFHNGIDLLTDIPDTMYDSMIPKLTFQPVVENSIIHGILERPEKTGHIVITGWLEEEDMVFVISDDGVGMNSETLEGLFKERPEGAGAPAGHLGGTNIGIFNTHRRLKLLYGGDCGLSCKSAPGEGCEVTIRIKRKLP